MPNSANRSNNNSNKGKGKPEEADHRKAAPKPNPERSDIKYGNHPQQDGHEGDTSRSSSQGRKEASGGEVE